MITIDVIKIGYKQDKEGFVLSFRLHPNDDHDAIARADLGSQWQMKLVPLDDDGNAQNTGEALPSITSPAREAAPTGQAGAASRTSRKAVAPEKRLVQQAALCCADPLFRHFLHETCASPIIDEEDAASFVREHCGVASRSEILLGTDAAKKWDWLFGRWLVWRRASELTSS